jgi:hypothetical protein
MPETPMGRLEMVGRLAGAAAYLAVLVMMVELALYVIWRRGLSARRSSDRIVQRMPRRVCIGFG